ncbi:MAG: hypothetical protein HYV35_02735 [Lentisphaerae bacterium]|nr:hypothetical protein [Lentisphaerota bacterium]
MNHSPNPLGGNAYPALAANAVTPAQLLCLAKGFARIFWGVFLMIGLFLSQAVLEAFQGMRIPAYVAGACLIGSGVWLLHSTGPLSPRWQRHTRTALVLVALIIYFAPFVGWWYDRPQENFFLLNVLSLLLTGMGILLLVNLLTAETFRLFQERGSQIESQVFALGVVILMIAPFLIGLIFTFLASMRYHFLFAEEIWLTASRVPSWLYLATTLPCALTLIASWKAKAFCYQRLWDSGKSQL